MDRQRHVAGRPLNMLRVVGRTFAASERVYNDMNNPDPAVTAWRELQPDELAELLAK